MKRWIIGSVLFVSLGLNIAFVAMVAGRQAGQQIKPGRLVMERIKELPPEKRKKALEILKTQRPQIKEAADELRRLRQETFAYITSDNYEREGAERQLTQLRKQSALVQKKAQHMMLDMADTLPPEQRDTLLQLPHMRRR